MKCKILALLATCTLSSMFSTPFAAYPERPVRLVVPFPPGGAADIVGRILAQKLTEDFAQQVLTDNRAGGAQTIATDIVAKSSPDGYTLLLASVTHGINPGLLPKLPYDSMRDFSPISLIAESPLVFVVHPSLPARSTKELIALARAKPGQLNYASSGNGSGGHLAMELFRNMTNINMVHVPYKGAALALIDVISGQAQLMLTSPLAAVPHVKSGKLRLLGVSGRARSSAMPDVPTIAEAGVRGYEATLWYAVLAPAGTPREVITRLNAAIRKALGARELRERFSSYGVDPTGSSPEEAAAHIRGEIEKWRKVIKTAGITVG